MDEIFTQAEVDAMFRGFYDDPDYTVDRDKSTEGMYYVNIYNDDIMTWLENNDYCKNDFGYNRVMESYHGHVREDTLAIIHIKWDTR